MRKFAAYVAASAAAGHRVEDRLRLEIEQQVADEIAAAIARIASVAILAGSAEVVQAGQLRHRAGVDRCSRQLRVNRPIGLWIARATAVLPGAKNGLTVEAFIGILHASVCRRSGEGSKSSATVSSRKPVEDQVRSHEACIGFVQHCAMLDRR